MLQIFAHVGLRVELMLVKSSGLQRGLSTHSFYTFCIEGNEETNN